MGVAHENTPKNQPHFSLTTLKQFWLGKTKPKHLSNHTNGIQGVVSMVISPIYIIHLKLGENIVDYKLCNIEIYALLNFWFLHMLKYLILVLAQKGQL